MSYSGDGTRFARPTLINRSIPLYFLFVAAALGGAILFVVGCGGGGSNISYASGGFVSARVPISWATRARAIGGPSSALSVVLTFDAASPTRQDVSVEFDRNEPPTGYLQTYLTTQKVKAGVDSIHIRFYSEPGAQGSLVAAADASLLVKADGTLAKADGSPLGTIQTIGQVASVSVTGPLTVEIGTPQAVSTEVFDGQNDLLAISGGSVFYQVAGITGSASIDANGNVIGATAGTVTVTATVDGISSLPATVTVLPQTLTMTSLSVPTTALAVDPVTGNLWATVPATHPTYGNSVIEIDATSHKVVSSIPVGSNPNLLAFSDDGTALYVGLQGADSYARVDPIGKKLISTYPLTSTGFGGAQYATWIAVQPGNPNVVALCQQDNEDSGYTGGCIYNNGVLLPSNMGIYGGSVFGFTSATTLWGSNAGFSPQSLYEATVSDTSGATTTQTNDGLGGSFGIFGGNLYFTNGQVVSGKTGNLLGTFPVSGWGQALTVDVKGHTAYLYVEAYASQNYQLLAFDTASFDLLTYYVFPTGPNSFNALVLLPSGQLALSDGTNVYFAPEPAPAKAGIRTSRRKP